MSQSDPAPIERLLEIMARLRNKETGCPWDIEQDFKSIAPHTLEEAYEVADAIERGHMDDLREELGDLLLQVVFHAQMASEDRLFEFNDVVQTLCDKLVFRHPHVFGDAAASTSGDVLTIWEDRKRAEKAAKGGQASLLDNIPLALPALTRAQKISKRAAKAGFEWDATEDVLDKVLEELEEMRQAIRNKDAANMKEELGDLFFVLVNLGRRLDIDCEDAARQANRKFEQRFKGMEAAIAAEGQDMTALSLDQWNELWDDQKAREKKTA